MKIRNFGIALLCTVGIITACQQATAQQAVADLNVVGVKLGMTEDQARAALLQYDPAIQVTTIYGFPDFDGTIMRRSKIEQGPGSTPMPLTVPVGLIGVSLSHAYDNDHQDLPAGDAKDRVIDVAGEWFALSFTPNETSGSLYAIGRTVRYPAADVDPATLPDAAGFRAKVLAAYGKPSVADDPDFEWMYDIRGRQLSESNREYQRCSIGPIGPGSVPGRYDFSFATSNDTGPRAPNYTRDDLNKALTDVDGQTLGDAWSNISSAFGDLAAFAPAIDVNVATQGVDPSKFRQCGIDFQVNLENDDRVHLDNFTEYLGNIDRAYFDNGLKKYFDSKTPAVPVAQTPKL